MHSAPYQSSHIFLHKLRQSLEALKSHRNRTSLPATSPFSQQHSLQDIADSIKSRNHADCRLHLALISKARRCSAREHGATSPLISDSLDIPRRVFLRGKTTRSPSQGVTKLREPGNERNDNRVIVIGRFIWHDQGEASRLISRGTIIGPWAAIVLPSSSFAAHTVLHCLYRPAHVWFLDGKRPRGQIRRDGAGQEVGEACVHIIARRTPTSTLSGRNTRGFLIIAG